MKRITLFLITMLLCLTLVACGGGNKDSGSNGGSDSAAVTSPNTNDTDAECKHDWKAADCVTPKTCTVCGATEGEALGHTPENDDGDCTTEVKCTVCGEITTAAKNEHIAHADDSNCTTPVTCTKCDHIF